MRLSHTPRAPQRAEEKLLGRVIEVEADDLAPHCEDFFRLGGGCEADSCITCRS